jgi:hypothetical protein
VSKLLPLTRLKTLREPFKKYLWGREGPECEIDARPLSVDTKISSPTSLPLSGPDDRRYPLSAQSRLVRGASLGSPAPRRPNIAGYVKDLLGLDQFPNRFVKFQEENSEENSKENFVQSQNNPYVSQNSPNISAHHVSGHVSQNPASIELQIAKKNFFESLAAHFNSFVTSKESCG